MPRTTLLVIKGIDQGKRIDVGDKAVNIGRDVRNNFRLLDTEISRHHAVVQFNEGRFYLTDRNSSNGTYLNGQVIRSAALSNGDQVQMGRSTLLVSIENENSSRYAADLVDIVGAHQEEHSQIIGQVSQKDSHTYLGTPGSSVVASQPLDESELNRTLANLKALYRITAEVVSPSVSLEELLSRVLNLAIDVVGADRGCMLLSNSDTGAIAPEIISHRSGIDAAEKMPVSMSIVDYVVEAKQGVRTADARMDQRFETGQSILQAGIREAMCVPMQGRVDLMGAIYVDITTPSSEAIVGQSGKHRFDDEQLKLLLAIGRQSAMAIENNRYQQALLKAERLATMGQTIAMLSHHIKNILQGVRGGSYLIDMGPKDSSEELVRKGWGIVEKNQGKIYHLVMDMLAFSKERQPAFEKADLNETLNDICELMETRAHEEGLRLATELSDSLPVTYFDPEGIHRAVLNIVINALDALDGVEGGTVTIQSGYDEVADFVFVTVADNGPGIPPDKLNTVFNIFESTKGSGGTGLGLAVSQKIIREHGGEIDLESHPETGCRFTLAWPRHDENHPHPSHEDRTLV